MVELNRGLKLSTNPQPRTNDNKKPERAKMENKNAACVFVYENAFINRSLFVLSKECILRFLFCVELHCILGLFFRSMDRDR